MRPPSRRTAVLQITVLLVTVLLAPALLAPATPAAARQEPARQEPAGRPATTVTLVTGDTVTVLDADRATVRPGPGRGGIRFITTRSDGHLRVIPVDVLPLLAADTVDPRLFDVTTLLNFRYDDRRCELPPIVTAPAATA